MVPLLSEELVPSSFGEAFGPLPSLSENLPLIEEMPLIEGMPLIEKPCLFQLFSPDARLELATHGLTVHCSTD